MQKLSIFNYQFSIRQALLSLLMLVPLLTMAQEFSVKEIPDAVFAKMQGKSWKKDCPLNRADFRYLRVSYCCDKKGNTRVGEIICAKSVANELIDIFRELYAAKYVIQHIGLVDEYDADDERSMSANNTSCFNYRTVAGTKVLSKHSRGIAIDINPLWNPCVHRNGKIEPANGKRYAKSPAITPNDLCYKAFIKRGWLWGGRWKNTKDYQHFEK